VAALVEEVHQWLAEHRAGIRVAEELDPGRVHVDDDALLHVGDRVRRARHECLHLVAVLVCRGKRAGERSVQPRRAQLAGRDRLEPRPCRKCHDVLCSQFHRLGQVGLCERLADQDGRHMGSVAIADLERRASLFGVRDAQEDELGRGLRQRLAQGGQVT
jgi:hypothetical protein